jgi:hypothetical protein
MTAKFNSCFLTSYSYMLLCELVDNLVRKSDTMRRTMGLPLKDMVEDVVDEGTSRASLAKCCFLEYCQTYRQTKEYLPYLF